MNVLQSNYARIVVWHNDPRDLESPLLNRSFRIEVFHRLNEDDRETRIDDILLEGSLDETVRLLMTLGVNRVEWRATLLFLVGRLVLDSVPFDVATAIDHLKTDPRPLTCFVTDVTNEEILDRLQQWEKEREHLGY
jgi:hypothetical protein